jgi:hypothetical protein
VWNLGGPEVGPLQPQLKSGNNRNTSLPHLSNWMPELPQVPLNWSYM